MNSKFIILEIKKICFEKDIPNFFCLSDILSWKHPLVTRLILVFQKR